MEQPSPPTSLPKYLAEGLPKQDTETLQKVQNYIEALIEYRDQSVDTDELPEAAEPVDGLKRHEVTALDDFETGVLIDLI